MGSGQEGAADQESNIGSGETSSCGDRDRRVSLVGNVVRQFERDEMFATFLVQLACFEAYHITDVKMAAELANIPREVTDISLVSDQKVCERKSRRIAL